MYNLNGSYIVILFTRKIIYFVISDILNSVFSFVKFNTTLHVYTSYPLLLLNIMRSNLIKKYSFSETLSLFLQTFNILFYDARKFNYILTGKSFICTNRLFH